MADILSGIKIPDSKIAREAAELVRQHETELLYKPFRPRLLVRSDEGHSAKSQI